MNMVGGLDLHRRQITYDVLDVDSGEICEDASGSRTGRGSGAGWNTRSALEHKGAR